MSLSSTLRDIDRWVSVALLVLFFVFMISGYMITKGFIDRSWGILLHKQLTLPIMAVFTTHIVIQLRSFLIRRRIRSQMLINVMPLILGLISFAFILYLDQFFSL